MPAPFLMLGAALLFSLMGLCVKLASSQYSPSEILLVRSLVGVALLLGLARWRGVALGTRLPWMHVWRGVIGVAALLLWFWAIAGLPLATAMTLNQMSAIWMALFLLGGAILLGGKSLDPRLIVAVLVGFIGVALVLQPTFARDQLPWGLAGLASGMLAAMAYLQVTALGRAGEPEIRVVFYFSLAGVVAAGLLSLFTPAPPRPQGHSLVGMGLLLAVGVSATLAQVLMTAAYARGKVLANASLNYSGIVFSALLGWLVFDEAPGWLALLGMLLIVGAGLTATLLRSHQAKDLPSDAHNE
ncbi:DMT family transporter [Inhella proteolytica]|uniref:DMT family transporter n=1 Tax=Inhella proteolytica TaxID=2795029 RepID=A0A931NEY6_9BURK|nr:DMT family transporter [Inhella proteolytica]MBH9578207.1 DMT family transporter [Inhella proteolytica]